MKTIELTDEFLAQITRDDLKENYEMIREDLLKCLETGESTMCYSENVSIEIEYLQEKLKAFEIVLDYYGIEV